MLWMEYNIHQAGDNFKVEGEWPGELMGINKDGTPKGYQLYKPGDCFRVSDNGWLVKIGEYVSEEDAASKIGGNTIDTDVHDGEMRQG